MMLEGLKKELEVFLCTARDWYISIFFGRSKAFTVSSTMVYFSITSFIFGFGDLTSDTFLGIGFFSDILDLLVLIF